MTVTDISQPIEVSAVSPTTGWVDLEKAAEKWVESNITYPETLLS